MPVENPTVSPDNLHENPSLAAEHENPAERENPSPAVAFSDFRVQVLEGFKHDPDWFDQPRPVDQSKSSETRLLVSRQYFDHT